MLRILDFLDLNKIKYTLVKEFGQEKITIVIERDRYWIDDSGEKLYWDRVLTITRNRSIYTLTEKTGLNTEKVHFHAKKQKDLIFKTSEVLNAIIGVGA